MALAALRGTFESETVWHLGAGLGTGGAVTASIAEELLFAGLGSVRAPVAVATFEYVPAAEPVTTTAIVVGALGTGHVTV
jgi:hypothetical protein